MSEIFHVEREIAGRDLKIEVGRVARQADGSAMIRYGGTVVLAAAVGAPEALPDRHFLPLTVDYREKAYAAGKIPGGFFKREGRPTEKEILSARLIDRAIRPLFDKNIRFEMQVACSVLSSDRENDSDTLALTAAATAVNISDLPFPGPVAAVRVGMLNERLVLNPTFSELDESRMNIVVAGTESEIVMVEGEAREATEKELVQALEFAMGGIRDIAAMQKEIVERLGRVKRVVPAPERDSNLEEKVRAAVLAKIDAALVVTGKEERREALQAIEEETVTGFSEEFPESEDAVKQILKDVERERLRGMILEDSRRADGRGLEDIRPITIEVGFLPRTHGSALFTRGETQALVVTALGTASDEQKIEELEGEHWKTFLLHYNFPSYSVGEVRPIRGPGRREIGHGALAERALSAVIPSNENFPYTIRLVSDVLESNGSSSMATVCGGSLALMDAGVPLKEAVAGIAMGLIKEGDRTAILTDILGLEDHLGDMDFKVAGTRAGVTAIQMDIKIGGLDFKIMEEALERARTARLKVLDTMRSALPEPRSELSPYAPRIIVLEINPERIRDVIGPGGRTIKRITEETGATIDIDDTG
ncbi:MAG: polyribonucleotide nucleotidyltransferase, partial [Candidatus Eisenbacteria bacterium]|nr:polyribonucleotide nucleotidyltransferase [Candidatus Eisenbacteria bacterium]